MQGASSPLPGRGDGVTAHEDSSMRSFRGPLFPRLRVAPRAVPLPAWRVALLTLAALGGGLLFAAALFAASGADPGRAIARIFGGSFGSAYGLGETVTKAIPLMLCGAGLCLAFRAGVWNIGAEGQLLMGAAGAALVALRAPEGTPQFLLVPLLFAAGALAGGLYGLLPALLRTRFQVNEAVASLLLNYIAADFIQYLIYGPLKMTGPYRMPQSDEFPAAAELPVLAGTRVHLPTLALAALACLFVARLLFRARFGREAELCGRAPGAARYAGIPAGRTVSLVFLLCGALAGLAGAGEVAGIHRHLTQPWSISSGYGYAAILTACLARNHPLLLPVSALFFGGLLVGGDAIQTSLNLPFAAVHVFNGTILIALLLAEYPIRHRIGFAARAEVRG